MLLQVRFEPVIVDPMLPVDVPLHHITVTALSIQTRERGVVNGGERSCRRAAPCRKVTSGLALRDGR